jgi:hypothetical protein
MAKMRKRGIYFPVGMLLGKPLLKTGMIEHVEFFSVMGVHAVDSHAAWG